MRADFYIGLGDNARWLGSVGDGGHPNEVTADHDLFNLDGNIEDYTEETFVGLVRDIIAHVPDHVKAALAERNDEWPWDYPDSARTAFTYAFNNGCIHVFEEGFMVAQHYPNGARRPSTFPPMAAGNATVNSES